MQKNRFRNMPGWHSVVGNEHECISVKNCDQENKTTGMEEMHDPGRDHVCAAQYPSGRNDGARGFGQV